MKYGLIVAMAFFLTACGGGGSEEEEDGRKPTPVPVCQPNPEVCI